MKIAIENDFDGILNFYKSNSFFIKRLILFDWNSFETWWFWEHFSIFVFCSADGSILTELFFQRQRFVRKEKFRISIGTWNINGDKNPALEDQYPSILDAWILDGPENLGKNRKENSIPTIGQSNENVEMFWEISFRFR